MQKQPDVGEYIILLSASGQFLYTRQISISCSDSEQLKGNLSRAVDFRIFLGIKKAGRQGFEPRFYGPEPHVLPLDDRPVSLDKLSACRPGSLIFRSPNISNRTFLSSQFRRARRKFHGSRSRSRAHLPCPPTRSRRAVRSCSVVLVGRSPLTAGCPQPCRASVNCRISSTWPEILKTASSAATTFRMARVSPVNMMAFLTSNFVPSHE